MSPSVRVSGIRSFMRLMERRKVDFPHPDGPMSAVTRCSGMVSEMEWSAWAAPPGRPRLFGGSVSGEHGLGLVKRGRLEGQWPGAALALHDAVKRAFDPAGLLNPGKKR